MEKSHQTKGLKIPIVDILSIALQSKTTGLKFSLVGSRKVTAIFAWGVSNEP